MKGFSPSEEVPVATIADRVRDMMVIAIPRLLIDEQITLVEPDEFLADDGGAKLFAKQFEYDDTPRMDVTDEVYDLMRLAVPSIGIPVDEMAVSESYSDLPEDGLDGAWEIPCQEEVAETVRLAKENIWFALIVKLLVLVLGALGLVNMWAAVFADVGVAVIAIANSMRALRVK